MKNCFEFKESISLYIDGELAADEGRLFEEHLGSCAECRSEYDEIVRIVGLCRDVQDVELPDNFREELHKKLVAAAENAPEKAARQRMKYARLFSSIAAGFVLIFLFGSVYWFGFSPQLKIGGGADNAMKSAAAPEAQAQAGVGAATVETTAGATNNNMGMYFTEDIAQPDSPTIAGGTAEAGRATAKNRNLQAPAVEYAKSVEAVYTKTAVFTVFADNPAVKAETVKTVAGGKDGEEQSNTAYGGDIVLTFSIPDNQYEGFTQSLSSTFGQDVEQGEMKSVDRTADLSSLVDESNTIDSEIKKLEDADSAANADKINELKAQQQKVQSGIENIRLTSDFTTVTVTVKKR